MSDEIRNCEFRFKCPMTWDALETTAIESQRYCTQCQKVVHHCRTPTELEWAIVRNLCVAVRIAEPQSTSRGDDRKIEDYLSIGDVSPDYFAGTEK